MQHVGWAKATHCQGMPRTVADRRRSDGGPSAEVERLYAEMRAAVQGLSGHQISRFMVELQTGGNIRLEEGKAGDVWYRPGGWGHAREEGCGPQHPGRGPAWTWSSPASTRQTSRLSA